MVKVFLSQPMTGKTASEILDARQKAELKIKQVVPEDFEIIESYLPKYQDTSNPIEALGVCIQLLSKADLVVFLDGWKNSKGCTVERLVCELYGIKVLEI